MFFDMLARFLQLLIDLIVGTLNLVFSFFPDSPLRLVENTQYSDYLSKINYFIPVYEFLAIAEAWIICVGIFYAYYLWGKWLRALN